MRLAGWKSRKMLDRYGASAVDKRAQEAYWRLRSWSSDGFDHHRVSELREVVDSVNSYIEEEEERENGDAFDPRCFQ